MEFGEFIKLTGRKKQTIFTIVFLAVILTITASLAFPMKYSVRSRLLVIQNASTSDAYSLSKSNEYLGNLLAEVVHSSSFYTQVVSSGSYGVDSNYFSGSYSSQIKKWQKTVATKTAGDTGIIEITVFHTDIQEARRIAYGVNDILINQNKNYHGSDNVRVSIIDQPLVSTFPVKPNIAYNALAAFITSLIFSLFYIYIFPEKKYDISLLSGKRREKKLKRSLGRPVLEKGTAAEDDQEEIRLNGSMRNILR